MNVYFLIVLLSPPQLNFFEVSEFSFCALAPSSAPGTPTPPPTLVKAKEGMVKKRLGDDGTRDDQEGKSN